MEKLNVDGDNSWAVPFALLHVIRVTDVVSDVNKNKRKCFPTHNVRGVDDGTKPQSAFDKLMETLAQRSSLHLAKAS